MRLVAQRKAQALGAFPGLLDAIHDLAVPALQADLEAYYAQQRARISGRLKGGR
jgi:hypothetical protein